MSERKLYSWGEAEKKLSRKGQKRIEAILDTARRVLTESGLGDFSMNKVAANSGISLGNLQYYFPKKKDLLYALLNSLLVPAAEHIQATISEQRGAGEDKQLLKDILEYAFDSNTSDQNCAVVWNSTAMSLYDMEARAMLNEWYVQFRQLVVQAVRLYNPKLSKKRIESVTLFITAAIEGHAMVWRYTVKNHNQLKRIKKEFIGHILHVVEG